MLILGQKVRYPLKLRGWHFLRKGSQIYKKSASIKLRPSYFGNKTFMTPHHRYTLPPKQAKIVLKSIFLNKINTLSVRWSLYDSLHFGHQKFYDPPIFLSKNLWPPVYLGPPSEENASPFSSLAYWYDKLSVIVPRNSRGGIGSLLTPVLMLWGGCHFVGHVWSWVIVPPGLARSFGAINTNHRCRVSYSAII